MKASEVIRRLRTMKEFTSPAQAATMLERYLALADELEAESTNLNIGNVGYKQGVASAAKRLREIAEGES